MLVYPLAQGAKPSGIGFACACRCVDETMRALPVGIPGFFLKGEGLPMVACKPSVYGI
jgi:hypothetical protein